MKGIFTLFLAISLALAGCTGMSATEQRVLSGGAIGAGGGALIGAAAGSAGIGAAMGGGAGLLAGYAYDRYQRPRESASPSLQAASSKKPRSNQSSKRRTKKKSPEKAPPQETPPPVPHAM